MNNTKRAASGLLNGSIGLVALIAALPLLALMVACVVVPFMFAYAMGGWTAVALSILVTLSIIVFYVFAFRK